MFRAASATCISFALAVAFSAAGDTKKDSLSAVEIVDRNVAARGGLQAWRSVQTMSLAGKIGAGGNRRASLPTPLPGGRSLREQAVPVRPADEVQLPFLMELKRPRKMRFELQFNGETAVQVYDGTNGWKLRPFLGRRVVEPYSPEEVAAASMQADLDGPLIDSAAKGTKVELDGMEPVEGRDTYKLKLTLKSGSKLHIWVDAQTFLDAKIEGQPRRLDGVDHPVEVYFRDYRAVNGLQVAFILETKVLPVGRTGRGPGDIPVPPEKTIVSQVLVNPKLEDKLFLKPETGVEKGISESKESSRQDVAKVKGQE